MERRKSGKKSLINSVKAFILFRKQLEDLANCLKIPFLSDLANAPGIVL